MTNASEFIYSESQSILKSSLHLDVDLTGRKSNRANKFQSHGLPLRLPQATVLGLSLVYYRSNGNFDLEPEMGTNLVGS